LRYASALFFVTLLSFVLAARAPENLATFDAFCLDATIYFDQSKNAALEADVTEALEHRAFLFELPRRPLELCPLTTPLVRVNAYYNPQRNIYSLSLEVILSLETVQHGSLRDVKIWTMQTIGGTGDFEGDILDISRELFEEFALDWKTVH